MKQSYKTDIYQLGTDEQADFVVRNAGLTELEDNIFWAWRRGEEDIDIAGDYLDGNEKKLRSVERRVRTKIAIAVFDCITFKMSYLRKISENTD